MALSADIGGVAIALSHRINPATGEMRLAGPEVDWLLASLRDFADRAAALEAVPVHIPRRGAVPVPIKRVANVF